MKILATLRLIPDQTRLEPPEHVALSSSVRQTQVDGLKAFQEAAGRSARNQVVILSLLEVIRSSPNGLECFFRIELLASVIISSWLLAHHVPRLRLVKPLIGQDSPAVCHGYQYVTHFSILAQLDAFLFL